MDQDFRAYAESHLQTSIAVKQRVAESCLDDLMVAIDHVAECFERGGKLLLCGNGGSAADAQHLAAEFISTLSQDFPRAALPAMALTTDSSTLTARANDYGFDEVFSRQVEAFGKPGDILISFSTSGNSKNCLKAMSSAAKIGLKTIVFCGGSGGDMSKIADCSIKVPNDQTMHIQESHVALYHILCYAVERKLNPNQK